MFKGKMMYVNNLRDNGKEVKPKNDNKVSVN